MHTMLRNASVPSVLLGHAGGGTERVDIAIADGRIEMKNRRSGAREMLSLDEAFNKLKANA